VCSFIQGGFASHSEQQRLLLRKKWERGKDMTPQSRASNHYPWELFASLHRGLIAKALKSAVVSTAGGTLTVDLLISGLYDVAGKKLTEFFEIKALERLKQEVLAENAIASGGSASNRLRSEGYAAVHDDSLSKILRSAAIIAAAHGLKRIDLRQIVAAIALDKSTLTELQRRHGLSLKGLTGQLCYSEERSA
jgi:hypothetical protein